MENAVQHRLEAIGITSPTTFRREVAKVEEMFEEMQQCEGTLIYCLIQLVN